MLARRHLSALALALVSTATFAQNVTTQYVSGDEVKSRSDAVMAKIAWTNDLEALQAKAIRENKLVFWMQIVGELDGGL